MPAVDLRPVRGTRVVADPMALSHASTPPGAVVLKIAADEALVLGDGPVHVDDPHALVLSDNGWSAATLTWPEVDRLVLPHVEWHLHRRRGLAQGRVAGVPAKLWMEDERVLLITQTAYADELAERLR